MTMTWKNGALALMAMALIAGAVIMINREPVQAQEGDKSSITPRYSVVETQAHNLLVTDNATNTLYFYTVDKDEKVGADLKLRASMDLRQVGKAEIKIKATK